MDQSNSATRQVLDALESWASSEHDNPLEALSPARALCNPAVSEVVFMGRAIEYAMAAGNTANLDALRSRLSNTSRDWITHTVVQGHTTALAWLMEQPVFRKQAGNQLRWLCGQLVREALLIDNPATTYTPMTAPRLADLASTLSCLPGFAAQLRDAIDEAMQDHEQLGVSPRPSGQGHAILEQLLLDLRTPSPAPRQGAGIRRL